MQDQSDWVVVVGADTIVVGGEHSFSCVCVCVWCGCGVGSMNECACVWCGCVWWAESTVSVVCVNLLVLQARPFPRSANRFQYAAHILKAIGAAWKGSGLQDYECVWCG